MKDLGGRRMKVVGLTGSPRPSGYTNYLVDLALNELAERGFETERIDLCRQRILPCLAHDDCSSFATCKQKDDAPLILEKYYAADAVILGSPVYFHNVTSQMKAFMDRCYFPYVHKKRLRASCIGIVMVAKRSGSEHGLEAFRRFLKPSVNLPEDRIITVTGYVGEPSSKIDNPGLAEEARQMGRRIVEMLGRAQS
jgi:multimeric flavodoxin WrbA